MRSLYSFPWGSLGIYGERLESLPAKNTDTAQAKPAGNTTTPLPGKKPAGAPPISAGGNENRRPAERFPELGHELGTQHEPGVADDQCARVGRVERNALDANAGLDQKHHDDLLLRRLAAPKAARLTQLGA